MIQFIMDAVPGNRPKRVVNNQLGVLKKRKGDLLKNDKN